MQKAKGVLIVLAVLVLISAGSLEESHTASAQVDDLEVPAHYYLYIDGIEGEATHVDHVDELDIASFVWGELSSSELPGTARRPGGVAMDDFVFTAPVSKASPKLMQSVADGTRFSEAVFTVREAGTEQPLVILEVKLRDVGITSYHLSGMSDRPTDNFSLDFTKITYKYNVIGTDHTIEDTIVGSWDLESNTP
jgi:type VI secretion system secreted protein Hcp